MAQKLRVLTMNQLQMLNASYRKPWRCILFGHKLRPVLKALPIRVGGRERRFEIERCVRCRFTEVGQEL